MKWPGMYRTAFTLGKTMKHIATLLTTFCALSIQTAAFADPPTPAFFNGHAYLRVNASLTWAQADAQAAQMTYHGVTGHLVTIQSEDENDFVDSVRSGGNCWIGATDAGSEGEWYWVTGEQFWTGGLGGSVLPGMFEAWNNGEPNNAGGDENGAHMFASGSNGWNDLHDSDALGCYLVEFDVTYAAIPSTNILGLAALLILTGLLGWRATRHS